MKYEPIKEKVSSLMGQSPVMRRLLYSFLGIIFLREWHVKRALREIMKGRDAVEVLDAGSGFGQYSYYCASKLDAKVFGVDINKSEVEKCNRFAQKMNLLDLSFAAADLEKLALTKKFDVIVSVDVMEHIRDDVKVFKNFSQVIRDGGSLLISTPSNFGGSDVHDHDEHSFIDEHFREGYSAEDITRKLGEAGLHVERLQYTYGKAGSWYWKLAIKLPVMMLNKSIALMVLLPFYYIVALPFSLAFMAVDYFFPPAKGSGLLIVARK